MPGGARLSLGILGSALLAWLYARGGAGWLLGFVVLVPWLRTQDANRSLVGALLSGWAMSLAYTAAVCAWFGSAIGAYTQIGTAAGLALLLIAAPLFQPQFLSFAIARHLAGRRFGRVMQALAGAAAWVATESLLPRVLGDTLGYGLYPSVTLRQAADLGGAAGLTLMLLLANEAIALAMARRGDGVRAIARPLAVAVLIPLLLAAYGLGRLAAMPAPAGQPLRMGLVQANIVDYERLRREKGAAAVVREVLDTHYAMTYDAVERQKAHAVLWSETVYPTTFGKPKSEAGAELDREILDIVTAAGVPFVFGTYDRDAEGEYNAAAFVNPASGLLGSYRKTRLFPLTEYVPAWLDSPTLRRWLPWAGNWRPGSGARVFPLRLADGREIPALPLICLDDMDAELSIDGARLGARVILTMSNDSWFSQQPQGAELHHAAAAFRSIETRLPQFRVTTNGYSAVIDRTGTVIASAGMGERVLVVGELPVQEPPPTLMVAWGDWIGYVGAAFIVLLALLGMGRAGRKTIDDSPALRSMSASGAKPDEAAALESGPPLPADVALLPPAARLVAASLRAFARASLLWMAGLVLLGDGALHSNTLAQLRVFAGFFLVPEIAAWLVLQAFAARVSIDSGMLVFARGRRRVQLAVQDVVAVEHWRLPIPAPGAWLRLATGQRWRYGVVHADAAALPQALHAHHAAVAGQSTPESTTSSTASVAAAYAQACVAARRQGLQRLRRLQHPVVKFVFFPLLLALPAFRMHQHIAYGSTLGEYHTFGLGAYTTTLALWWASWAMGVVLCAAVLRAAIEAGTLTAVLVRPQQAMTTRRWLEGLGLAALYVGLPALLLLRIVLS